MADNLFDEICVFLEEQPLLKVLENEKEYVIEGVYKYTLDFEGYIAQGNRKIKLNVLKDFPNSIPNFYVFDYPEDMEHIYADGSVCLATIGETIRFLSKNNSFLAFIHKFINSFIFTLYWFEKYKTYPFEDRKHGYKGSLDYYLNDLNLTLEQYKEMVSMIYFKNYRGHSLCLCGSNKKLRSCHGDFILPIIQNESYRQLFLQEAYYILEEDNINV